MRYISLLISLIFLWFVSLNVVEASIFPDGTEQSIRNVSIGVNAPPGDDIYEVSRGAGFRILTLVKVIISGIALVWIVLIGAYMIIFSDNEERVKNQRKQFTYVLVGFLFLNVPGLVYTAFFWDVAGSSSIGWGTIGDGTEIDLWDRNTLFGINGFIPQIIGFFELFIFGVAIIMLTWGLFRLIVSGWDEEIQKKAKNQLFYSILGLIFLGFVKVWWGIISRLDFFGEFPTVANKILGLALYFAPPIVIFFLILAAYYMITSAWDEERVKKAKSIFINTLIASLILLGAYSFVTDLATAF
jgi:hypothetical protein